MTERILNRNAESDRLGSRQVYLLVPLEPSAVPVIARWKTPVELVTPQPVEAVVDIVNERGVIFVPYPPNNATQSPIYTAVLEDFLRGMDENMRFVRKPSDKVTEQ